MNVRQGDDEKQRQRYDRRKRRRTEDLRSVRTGDHYDSFERKTSDQPVGEVADDAAGVVGQPAVGVVEVDGRIDDLRPFEPDAEQFEVHDAEIGDGEGEQVDGRADAAHVVVREDDEVETVRDCSGDDDRQEGHADVGEYSAQPGIVDEVRGRRRR